MTVEKFTMPWDGNGDVDGVVFAVSTKEGEIILVNEFSISGISAPNLLTLPAVNEDNLVVPFLQAGSYN